MATSSHYRLGSIWWFVTFESSVETEIQKSLFWQVKPEQMQQVQRILAAYLELQSIE